MIVITSIGIDIDNRAVQRNDGPVRADDSRWSGTQYNDIWLDTPRLWKQRRFRERLQNVERYQEDPKGPDYCRGIGNQY